MLHCNQVTYTDLTYDGVIEEDIQIVRGMEVEQLLSRVKLNRSQRKRRERRDDITSF